MPRVYKHNHRDLGTAARFANLDLADKITLPPLQHQSSQKKRPFRPGLLKSTSINHLSPTSAATTAATTNNNNNFTRPRSSLASSSSDESDNEESSDGTALYQETCENELKKWAKSAQHMGQYIRLRREQKEMVRMLTSSVLVVPQTWRTKHKHINLYYLFFIGTTRSVKPAIYRPHRPAPDAVAAGTL